MYIVYTIIMYIYKPNNNTYYELYDYMTVCMCTRQTYFRCLRRFCYISYIYITAVPQYLYRSLKPDAEYKIIVCKGVVRNYS